MAPKSLYCDTVHPKPLKPGTRSSLPCLGSLQPQDLPPPWLLTDFGTATAAIFIVLAVRLRGTPETQALDGCPCADTALGTAFGDPGRVFL